jgi:hypothetical protein
MATKATGRTARRRPKAGVRIMEPLNLAVSQLIKENRMLKRQVSKLSHRSEPGQGGVDRSLRLLKRRVQRALGTSATRKRRPTTH